MFCLRSLLFTIRVYSRATVFIDSDGQSVRSRCKHGKSKLFARPLVRVRNSSDPFDSERSPEFVFGNRAKRLPGKPRFFVFRLRRVWTVSADPRPNKNCDTRSGRDARHCHDNNALRLTVDRARTTRTITNEQTATRAYNIYNV